MTSRPVRPTKAFYDLLFRRNKSDCFRSRSNGAAGQFSVLLEQRIAGTVAALFFAALKNAGAATNVVSMTQTTVRITKDPDCAAEKFAVA
jgi:hypothetical protein